MTRVLLAFDGSPSARAAVQRAATAFPGAEAVVVNVALGIDELRDAGSSGRIALPDEVIRAATERLREEALSEARAAADEGARIAEEAGFTSPRAEVRPAEGRLDEAIVEAARDAGADVIACGTHGHGAVVRAVLGSLTSALVRDADLPVLVVAQDAAAGDGPVLIGYDGSEHAARALGACGALLPGAEAVVTYVWRSRARHALSVNALRHAPLEEVRGAVGEFDEMLERWAAEDAEEGARLARERGLDARALSIESAGAASGALLDAAAEHDSRMVVVGRRGRGAVASAFLGSVSASLLHAAERPLLVV